MFNWNHFEMKLLNLRINLGGGGITTIMYDFLTCAHIQIFKNLAFLIIGSHIIFIYKSQKFTLKCLSGHMA